MRGFWVAVSLLVFSAISAVAQPTGITPSATWYWQLFGTVNTTRPATVYDIDGADASTALIQSLKAKSHKVICYFDAGGAEKYRADFKDFPASALGRVVDGWPDERWLDIRDSRVLDVMKRRMDTFAAKGCDGLEPDMVEAYSSKSGFPITKAQQINYNRAIAAYAHSKGMLVALKNNAELAAQLVGDFDFAVVEQCFQYRECPSYSPFVKANKAVLVAEYAQYAADKCTKAKQIQFSLAFYNLALNGRRYQPCP